MGQSYFAVFEDFNHVETAALVDEFQRLAQHQHWRPGSRTYTKQRQKCFEQAFNEHYSKPETTLQGWQDLCRELAIQPPPSSITHCKKARPSVYTWDVY